MATFWRVWIFFQQKVVEVSCYKRQGENPKDVKIQTNTYIDRNKLEIGKKERGSVRKEGKKCFFGGFKERLIELNNLSLIFCLLIITIRKFLRFDWLWGVQLIIVSKVKYNLRTSRITKCEKWSRQFNLSFLVCNLYFFYVNKIKNKHCHLSGRSTVLRTYQYFQRQK